MHVNTYAVEPKIPLIHSRSTAEKLEVSYCK